MTWICVERSTVVLLGVALFMLLGKASEAEIITDGTVGSSRNLSGPDFHIGSDLGTIRGANLFHSFRSFNVYEGESATFTGPDNITNVISRVTGGATSDIDGLLRSEVGKADFYFINPAGVIFGSHAQVDVPAAFHAGTADEVCLDDGAVFSATNPNASTLSMAQPESFGFLSPQPATLTINGSRLEFSPTSGVSMIAGDVTIRDGASLTSEGGEIHITAVGDAEATANLASGSLNSDAGGTIAISGSSTLDVSGAQANESVALRGGLIDIEDSVIAADHSGAQDATGEILLEADRVSVVNSDVHAKVFGAGRGNDIVVVAKDLQVDAATAPDGRSRLTTRVASADGGAAGDVRVGAARVALTNGGQLSSIVEDSAAGRGGTVEVRASDAITIAGSNEMGYDSGIMTTMFAGSSGAGGSIMIDSPTAALTISDGGRLQSATVGAGKAGDITIDAHDLKMADSAVISSITQGSGNAGAIQVDAAEAVGISGSYVYADTEGPGDANSIIISANEIEIQQGRLDVTTTGRGKAGEIRLEARDSVILKNDSKISAWSGASLSDSLLCGDAGTVSITTSSLSMLDSSIDVFSDNCANAGRIEVHADRINVDTTTGNSAGFDASNTWGLFLVPGAELVPAKEGRSGTIVLIASEIVLDHGADISINTDAGDGGSVIIDEANEFSLLNGANILTNTSGPGRGGDVQVNVTGTFLIEGGSEHQGYTSTGGISTSPITLDELAFSSATGPAGPISIAAGTLIVGEYGGIVSNSYSNAEAGPITLNVGTLELRDGGEISSSASNNGGPGADILITAREAVRVYGVHPIFLLDSSEISANAGFSDKGGNGGRIQIISSPLLVLEQGGELNSRAFGGGSGGMIEVAVDDLVIQSGGEINTTTTGAASGGTILIDANTVSINGESSGLIDTTGLFSETSLDSTGDAGKISVTARTEMDILAGGKISTSTSSAGNAGAITITAGKLLIDSDMSGWWQVSAISSSANNLSTGTVGSIGIDAGSLIINGGEISIAAEQTLPNDDPGTGPQGKIDITAGGLHLEHAGRITAESLGNVPASAIEIRADELLMEDGSAITTSSNNADGGPISIEAHLLDLEDSLITTSVEGAMGNGGDITLTTELLVLNGGFIQANTAAGRAHGGDILIDADALIPSSGEVRVGGAERETFQRGSWFNVIQAAAPDGVQGAISITTPELDISAALGSLSTRFAEPARLLTDPCAAMAGQAVSSLVQRGRGGIPAEPTEPAGVSFGGDRLDRLLSSPSATLRRDEHGAVMGPDAEETEGLSKRMNRCEAAQ
ncbi:MAG: filamentous hemagglutinin N-terminal domain-containing protein [Proteobacteria bacterium]|nr:filamentous hemagglutinin N-terminal domain-containing protein [Pseudomonadota bacterium]MBU4298139.1 filamentous hemagglutinin N-terminal domain-containing protein [Pseudomonadota bacterium]MCG2749521.1 filamentous hemagglutinin N-terminal domain-containing protein [Desulfobulbaceae bacterium]